MPIPAFRPDGYLPLGVHIATEIEVADRFAVEIFVLIELDDVPVFARLGEELPPRCRGLRFQGHDGLPSDRDFG